MIYWFSTYLNGKERKIDSLVNKLKLGNIHNRDWRRGIVNFFYENPVETCIWFEYKYKGYSFLKKSRRRKIYETRDKIQVDFLDWYSKLEFQESLIDKMLPNESLLLEEKKKLWKLVMIDNFLNGKYFYKESSAFWKLFPLKYDSRSQMIGDCNQIVSLYIWLFGLIDDSRNLQIKLLKNHVCIHMFGVDFEATNGHFMKYTEKSDVLDPENILAVNLLDIADPVEKKWDVNAVNTAKMHLIASLFDVDEDLVKENLRITYSNLGIFYLNQKNWEKARYFFWVAKDEEKIRYTYINESLAWADLHKYEKALKIAKKTKDPEFELQIKKNYFIWLTKQKQWKDARKLANSMQDKELYIYTYQMEFAELFEFLQKIKTKDKATSHKSKYERLLFLAKKIDNKEAVQSIQAILRKM